MGRLRLLRRGASLAEIEAVYRARFDEFCSVAAAIVGDRERGKDAVQDAFAGVVRGRRRFRDEGPLEAWIWRAVVNSAVSSRRRREPELLEQAIEPSTNGHVSEPRTDVQLAIALLPEHQRLALFLRYYADLDYERIAGVLGVRAGTVAATLHAAHRTLKRSLEEVHNGSR